MTNRRSGMGQVSKLVVGVALGACLISAKPAAAQSTIYASGMTNLTYRKRRCTFLVPGFCALVLAMAFALPAGAQTPTSGPNTGAIRFTGGVDVPSVYMFRGILQESKPKITVWPWADLGITLASGDGGLKSATINLGVWHSLQTGSAGTDGPSGHAHYEEDFYATLNLGFGGGIGIGVGFMALTSPNFMFETVKELQIKVTKAHRLNPYGFVAIELSEGSADFGSNQGRYLELGVGPSFALGSRASLTIPAKVGVSLKDYYESGGKDRRFGWFDVGAQVTVPLKSVAPKFGSWNIHGGVDVMALGETTKAFNEGKSSQVVGLFGIGVTY